MKARYICGAVIAAALAAGTAQAHHSGAMFASDKVLDLTGTIREFQWSNPPQLDTVGGDQPQRNNDGVEHRTGQPQRSAAGGLEAWTVGPGQKAQISIHPMRDGSTGGSFIKAAMGDGRVITTGSGSGGGAPSRPGG